MLDKIKNIFLNEKNESLNDSKNLFISSTPFVLNSNTKFVRKDTFTTLDLKNELLDIKKNRDEIFNIYWNAQKSQDSLTFESLNLKGNLFVIFPKLIGREFSKTTSFNITYKGESKEGLFEVMNGTGYFIIENTSEEKNIIIVKVKKGDLVLIPKDYSFTIINSNNEENLICFSLIGKNTLFKKNVLKNFNGAGMYYTYQGFIKNRNISSDYKLENITGDYIFDNSFDKKMSLYDEFIKFPEKFSFLK